MVPPSPNQPHRKDAKLAKRALAGSQADREKLGERLNCIPRFVSHLNGKLGRPLIDHELPDLAQDVVEVVWRKLPGYGGRAALETWIFRICNLELMNAARKKARHDGKRVDLRPDDEGRASMDNFAAPEDKMPAHLRFEQLYSGLSQLSPDEEAVLRRKHYENQSFEEIALELDLTASGVKHRYYSALRRLRSFMQDRQETEQAGQLPSAHDGR